MAQNQRRPQTAAVLHNRPFQQLGSLIKPTAQASRKLMLPNLYFIGEDGVDHINIAFDGKTDLGHALHQNSKFRFVHNLFGPFLTVEGFFRWLASEDGDDLYRTLNGIQCAHHAKRTKNKGFIPNLRFLIVDATWQKIQAYPEIQEDLIYSEMPFDSYFYAFEQINGQRVGTRTRYKNASWLVEGVEVIRNALKNGEIPNFEFLMDDREEYDRMVDLVMKAKPPVKVIEPKEPVVEEESVQPRPPQVQNPPGTGKKGRQKARRLERERLEAEAMKTGDGLTLVSIEPRSIDSSELVVQPMASPIPVEILESVTGVQPQDEVGRGLTSCINMVDEAPFQEHLPVASPAQADVSTGSDVVLELKSIEDADREYVNIWAKENQPAPNFGGFGLPAQPSFVGVQTSNDLGAGLPLDDVGPTQ